MAYPLNQDVKKPYSLEFLDGYLKISNGIGGSFCFLGTSVATVEGCNSVETCNFGFDTAQELASAINALLNPPLELDFIDGIGTSVQPTTAGVWEILVLPGAPANKVIQVFLDNSAFSGVPMGIRKVGSNVATQFDVEKHNFRNVKTNENGAIEVFATLIAGNNVFAYAGHFEL
jgi:hypothetical protein